MIHQRPFRLIKRLQVLRVRIAQPFHNPYLQDFLGVVDGAGEETAVFTVELLLPVGGDVEVAGDGGRGGRVLEEIGIVGGGAVAEGPAVARV